MHRARRFIWRAGVNESRQVKYRRSARQRHHDATGKGIFTNRCRASFTWIKRGAGSGGSVVFTVLLAGAAWRASDCLLQKIYATVNYQK